jgi:hypothetical protein
MVNTRSIPLTRSVTDLFSIYSPFVSDIPSSKSKLTITTDFLHYQERVPLHGRAQDPPLQFFGFSIRNPQLFTKIRPYGSLVSIPHSTIRNPQLFTKTRPYGSLVSIPQSAFRIPQLFTETRPSSLLFSFRNPHSPFRIWFTEKSHQAS